MRPALPRPRAGKKRVVLIVAIAVIAAAVVFAWRTAVNHDIVSTYLKVPRSAGSIIDDDVGLEPWEDYRRRRDDLKTLIVSPLVIDAALQQQDIANLDLTRRHSSAMEWLVNSIAVEFPNDGEVMRVSLPCHRQDADQAVKILDAVVRAFHDKVFLQQALDKASAHADLRIVVAEIKKRLDAQLQELHKMESATLPANETAIALLKDRCELEGKLLADLQLKMLQWDMRNALDERAERQGNSARNAVEILQKATAEHQ